MAVLATVPGAVAILGYAGGLLVSLLGCSLAVYILAIFRTERQCRDIPAPPRRSFLLGNVSDFLEMRNKLGLSNTLVVSSWIRDFGPVIWIRIFWKPHFFAVTPEIVKEMLLNSRHVKHHRFYRLFQAPCGARFMGTGLVSELNHEKWFHKRAIMNPAFRRRYLKGMMSGFNEGADALSQQLLTMADGRTNVAMLDQFNNTALDILAKISFSMNTGATTDPDCPFPAATRTALQGIQRILDSPLVELDPRRETRRFRQAMREAIGFIRQVGSTCIQERIKERRRGNRAADDILDVILETANDLEGDKEFQMVNMVDEFVTLFFAGQETTSNLMAFTIQQLGRNPEVYRRLQAEVDEIVGEKPVIEYEDLHKLEYMMRVLKETLRLYPPVPGTTRVTAHPVKYGNVSIPSGFPVTVMTGVMGRMEEYFDDPLLFNPDRFKQSDDGELPRHLYAYFPFSLGQRSCIGQQFALIEARVILAKLLQRFQFHFNQCQRQSVLDEVTSKPTDRCMTYISLRT